MKNKKIKKYITLTPNSIFIRCLHETEILEIIAKAMSTESTDIDTDQKHHTISINPH